MVSAPTTTHSNSMRRIARDVACTSASTFHARADWRLWERWRRLRGEDGNGLPPVALAPPLRREARLVAEGLGLTAAAFMEGGQSLVSSMLGGPGLLLVRRAVPLSQ